MQAYQRISAQLTFPIILNKYSIRRDISSSSLLHRLRNAPLETHPVTDDQWTGISSLCERL